MRFDWIRFLDHHKIEYVTRGSSVVAGNVACHCPFCGTADQSHHMGISLAGHGWGCWRNKAHRGKNPVRLVAALLGVSQVQARSLVGYDTSNVSDATLFGRVSSLFNSPTQTAPPEPLKFPSEIKRLDWSNAKPSMFFDYLYSRGYSHEEAVTACQKFWLRYAMSGEFSYRLIFPIRDEQGELVSWTGRAIAPDQSIRYKTLSLTKGSPRAHGPATDYLLREQQLHRGNDVLVVCEGPFDAMRIETVCSEHNVSATCLFTKTASELQIAKLGALSKHFRTKFLLLDQDAALSSLSVIERLRAHGYRNIRIPQPYKDPAATPTQVLRKMLREPGHVQ